MKHLKTYNESRSDGKDYTLSIDKILNKLDEEGIKYEDLYKTKNSLYFVTCCPFSLSFDKYGNDAQVIVEIDGITDNLGTYDINTELDEIIDTIIDFNIDTYKEYNK